MTARHRVVLSIYDDFDNPHYGGGGPTVVHGIATRLARDCDVLVVTGGRRFARSERDGVRRLHLPVVWAGPRGGQLLWALLLPIAAVLLRYDAWIESFTPPLSSNLLPLVTRRPVIGLAQALSGREMARRYGTRIPLALETRLLRRYDDVVVLNRHDHDVVTSIASRVRVHVIPNTVTAPTRVPGDAADGSFALFLGRIDITQKGLDLLLAAQGAEGGAADPELLPLVIAGRGRPQDEARLRELLARAGPRVCWVGAVHGEEKEELLRTCGYVVVPSREESFSLAALEGMARNRPVVHFDLPQLQWIPPGAGEVVPRFDVAALRAAMDRMSRDPAARSRAGRVAGEYARGRLGTEHLDRYRTLVDDALRSRRPRHLATSDGPGR